jgi:hypothetical protein
MPVNYQEIQRQVREFSSARIQRQQRLENLRNEMLSKLGEYGRDPEAVIRKIEGALRHNPALRCAVPDNEPIDSHFPLPELPSETLILAADGSQINPSRHDQVKFGLVNVGIIRLILGGRLAPTSKILSHLLRHEEMYSSDGLITESKVAFLRDLAERQILAQMALEEHQPVMTITDGPLELYSERGGTQESDQLIDDYIQALSSLAASGASTAGYIDKPESELVGRLLEIANLATDALAQAGKNRPYLEINDESLFVDILTTPGDRSAVFAIQSLFAKKFRDELSLHFFYLNVGRKGHPWLARVEIPAWVAHNPQMLDGLHAVLVAQTEILGTHPYPYVLHRAHEVALVTLPEKEQIEQMVIAEYRRQGMNPGDKSQKQSLKDLEGRKGY